MEKYRRPLGMGLRINTEGLCEDGIMEKYRRPL